jgi:hypothetical protein
MMMACWWAVIAQERGKSGAKRWRQAASSKTDRPPCAVVCRRFFAVPKSDLTFLLLFCQLGERLDRFGRQIDHHRPAQDREQPGWDFERA